MELCVLLLFLQTHQLAKDVAEERMVADSPLSASDLLPHFSQSNCDVGASIERTPQYLQHSYNEVLCLSFSTGQFFQLNSEGLQLAFEYEPAYLCWGVFGESFGFSAFEPLPDVP